MYKNKWRCITLFLIPLIMVGCGTTPTSTSSSTQIPNRQGTISKSASKKVPALPPAGSGRGGYYMDDGPADDIPEGLLDMPDADPQIEPYNKRNSAPYVVFGKRYVPITDERPFKQRGIGSWYGKKFHGQRTSSGELYDMFKMTAAHPTLPIPSYARVTNVDNGRQVIVRVNDRGPFHSSRIIDLSYTAALKLGYLGKGSGQLEVERLLPEEIERIASGKRGQAAGEQQTAQASPVPANSGRSQMNVSDGATVLPVAASGDSGGKVELLPVSDFRAGLTIEPNSPAQAPGFYLQLGAFSQPGGAESARSSLLQTWSPSFPPIEISQSNSLYRLHSGPFATRAEAAQAGARLQEAGLSKPMIVQR